MNKKISWLFKKIEKSFSKKFFEFELYLQRYNIKKIEDNPEGCLDALILLHEKGNEIINEAWELFEKGSLDGDSLNEIFDSIFKTMREIKEDFVESFLRSKNARNR